MKRDEDLIAVECVGQGIWWQIAGHRIIWQHFPKEAILGYDSQNREVTIIPTNPHSRVGFTSVTMVSAYGYHEVRQRKFWLSRAAFIVYFLGVPGSQPLFRFQDDLVNTRIKQKLFEPLRPLCE